MPERIPTAEIAAVDAETLEIDDTYPGTYGFTIRLTCNPGPEWDEEFVAVYDAAEYPGKPPVLWHGDRLTIFYLPRYADDLPSYLRFLEQMIARTNRAVEKRNSVLPHEEQRMEAFRQALRDAAKNLRK